MKNESISTVLTYNAVGMISNTLLLIYFQTVLILGPVGHEDKTRVRRIKL